MVLRADPLSSALFRSGFFSVGCRLSGRYSLPSEESVLVWELEDNLRDESGLSFPPVCPEAQTQVFRLDLEK